MDDKALQQTVTYIYGYIRRSRQDIERERKVDQDTLTEQRTLIEGILEDRFRHVDWDVFEEYGSGADALEARPVFLNIIEEIKSKARGTVAFAVKEISRLGRGSMTEMGFLLDLLQSKSIYIITPFKIYDPNESNDIRYLKFHMFMANQEYDIIKERMVNARLSYSKMGRWMTGGGGIPDGYKFNSYTQKLEPNEERDWVIQKIFDYYVHQGIGYNAISTMLRREGILTATGKEYWKPMVIRRLLLNPVYIGTVEFNKTMTVIENGKKKKEKRPEKDWIIVPNAHPPLIDEETFYKAAEIMQENRSSPKVRLEFEPTPLAGLIVCGSCNNKMQRQSSTQHYKRKDGNVSIYNKEFMQCLECKVYMKYNAIEEELIRVLEEDFLNVDSEILRGKLEELIDLENMQDKKRIDPTDRMAMLQKQLNDLEGEKVNLRRILRKGLIEDDDYLNDYAEVEKKAQEIHKQINLFTLQTQKEQLDELNVVKIQEGFNGVLTLYRSGELSKGEKNELLRGIFDYVVLEKTGKGKFNLHAYLNPNMLLSTASQ
ncbi:recombinase family protein [Bacillus coahuilensis]|uniref:recombinase family protein n=1 Tax=Bacillus coahuilensis TaxID=408580 RepID=UPI000185122E|nr:recombinase family protein [Bacillus coahuilensis]